MCDACVFLDPTMTNSIIQMSIKRYIFVHVYSNFFHHVHANHISQTGLTSTCRHIHSIIKKKVQRLRVATKSCSYCTPVLPHQPTFRLPSFRMVARTPNVPFKVETRERDNLGDIFGSARELSGVLFSIFPTLVVMHSGSEQPRIGM